jgi:chitosanase
MTTNVLPRSGLFLVVASLTVTGCGSGDSSSSQPGPIRSPARTIESSAGGTDETHSGGREPVLVGDKRRRVDELISAFENSTTQIQYDYAENIHDGRGVTAGRAGFTTATCDALSVIEAYGRRVGDNALSGFVPELHRLCDQESDQTSGLPEQDYIDAWKAASRDKAFRDAQDEVVDNDSFLPAMRAADKLGLTTALARAQLYDAAVQHGVGDDPDALNAMIERTNAHVGTPREAGEKKWLDAFFETRLATLENPANKDTTADWRESVDRVRCMRTLADAGNYDLDPPIVCVVYGDEYTIN